MQLPYDAFDIEKSVWLRRILVPRALIPAVTLVVCATLRQSNDQHCSDIQESSHELVGQRGLHFVLLCLDK